jgi:hypothetical protein
LGALDGGGAPQDTERAVPGPNPNQARPGRGRTYEEQLAELVAALDGNAEVIQNKRVEARLSKAMRQVDVWVRGKIIGQEDRQAELAKLLADPALAHTQ